MAIGLLTRTTGSRRAISALFRFQIPSLSIDRKLIQKELCRREDSRPGHRYRLGYHKLRCRRDGGQDPKNY